LTLKLSNSIKFRKERLLLICTCIKGEKESSSLHQLYEVMVGWLIVPAIHNFDIEAIKFHKVQKSKAFIDLHICKGEKESCYLHQFYDVMVGNLDINKLI